MIRKMSKNNKIFIRESSGLVRQFGILDAAGKVMNIMLPLAAFYTLLYAPGIPGADNFGLSALIGVLFAIPPFYIYLRLSELIPRSSGEYIYISRFLHPMIGTIQGITTIIGMTMFTASLIIQLTVIAGLIPLLQILGLAFKSIYLINLGNLVLTNPFYMLIVSEIFVLIYGIIISINNKILSKTVVISLVVGQILGTIIISGIFLIGGNKLFASSFNQINSQYGYTITYCELFQKGITMVSPLNFNGTLIMAILLWLWILAWFIGPSYFAGEFRGGKNTIRRGMILGWLIGAILLVLISFSSEYALKLPFFEYSSLNGWGNIPLSFNEGFVIWAGLMVHSNPMLLIIIGITNFIAEFAINAILLALATRVMLAMSFDRLLPEFLSKVSTKGIPIWASLISIIITAIWTYAQTVGGFAITPIGIIILIVIYQMVPAVLSSIFMVLKNNNIINLSNKERIKIFAIGIVATTDLLFSAIVVLFYGFINPIYGSFVFAGNSLDTILTIVSIPLVGSLLYYIMKKYREGQGINIGLAFKELPPE
ncbi:MAG: amino acid permease [Sulfolobus sp.]